MTDENIIDRLFEIFTRHGVRSYQNGGVSMAEHMLQTAAAAEGAAGAPHVVAAALLHDVGHFITDFAKLEDDPKHASMLEATVDRRHEKAGAVLLQPYFSKVRTHLEQRLIAVGAGSVDPHRPGPRVAAFLYARRDVVGLDHGRGWIDVRLVHAVVDQEG